MARPSCVGHCSSRGSNLDAVDYDKNGVKLLQDGLPVTHTVAGYELMGLRAGFSGQRWELLGDVRNVFDADYIATLSVLNVAGADARVLYPGAPLSAYTGVRFSF